MSLIFTNRNNLKCSSCNSSKPRTEYSGNQLRKAPKAKCNKCVSSLRLCSSCKQMIVAAGFTKTQIKRHGKLASCKRCVLKDRKQENVNLCIVCNESKSISNFTSNQLRRKSLAKCKKCVERLTDKEAKISTPTQQYTSTGNDETHLDKIEDLMYGDIHSSSCSEFDIEDEISLSSFASSHSPNINDDAKVTKLREGDDFSTKSIEKFNEWKVAEDFSTDDEFSNIDSESRSSNKSVVKVILKNNKSEKTIPFSFCSNGEITYTISDADDYGSLDSEEFDFEDEFSNSIISSKGFQNVPKPTDNIEDDDNEIYRSSAILASNSQIDSTLEHCSAFKTHENVGLNNRQCFSCKVIRSKTAFSATQIKVKKTQARCMFCLALRRCSSCMTANPKCDYSSNQLKKGSKLKCKFCVATISISA